MSDSSILQSELKNCKLGDQVFQFKADVIAQMLSPKLHREDSLVAPTHFDYLIDDPIAERAMMKTFRVLTPLVTHSGWELNNEKVNYRPLVAFLNDCVANCNTAYDIIQSDLPKEHHFKIKPRAERWFPHLHFCVFDKRDTFDCTFDRTKPDFVGVNDPGGNLDDKDFQCQWGTSKEFQIMIPVAVKKEWPKLISQASTYARSQFEVSPLRTFALIIALNYKTQELYYLIFHHGGLTSSVGFKLGKMDDCIQIQKILLSVLLWQSAEDAGIPSLTDSGSCCLPNISDEPIPLHHNNFTRFCVGSVPYHSLSNRGRNTKPSETRHDGSQHQDAHRALWFTVITDGGESLERCVDSKDLQQCLSQSILCWLSAYQFGFLHRDINIDNLHKLHEDIPRPFSASKGIDTLLERASKLGQPSKEKCDELRKIAEELDTFVKEAGLKDTCNAVITDINMSTYLHDYNFCSTRDRVLLSCPREFVSHGLLEAMKENTPYLQSPSDDLWSFFWTAMWATVFNSPNPTQENKNHRQKELRENRDAMTMSIMIPSGVHENNRRDPLIFREMVPSLRRWLNSLINLHDGCATQEYIRSKASCQMDYLMLFHYHAYSGVLEILRLLSGLKSREKAA